MALLATFKIGNKVKEEHIITSITDDEIKVALRKFNEMKAIGALRGDFEHNLWFINNETIEKKLDFTFNEIMVYKQNTLSYKEFIDMVKYYICLRFGNDTVIMYPRIINHIKNAVNETECFTIMPSDKTVLTKPGVADFVSLLPWPSEDFQMDVVQAYELNRHRTLAEYQSYFEFDHILNSYWKIASEEEKNYYYPLYLWWNITMVLPLRVTEFSVIPKKCITKKNDKWNLTIRRTAIKGKNDVEKRYKLDTDYKLYVYAISDILAFAINDYKSRSSIYSEADIDSMFSYDMYLSSRKVLFPTARDSITEHKYMEVAILNTILKDFFENIVSNKFGYSIVRKEELEDVDLNGQQRTLNNKEIAYINLGDTRHIALQNLLINGCNLLMAKEISGHETIDMIYHYSGNIKKLVKCQAYYLYEASKKQNIIDIDYNSNADLILADIGKEYVEVDSGKCFSKKMINENPADCYKVGGDCEICIYHDGIKIIEREFDDKITRLKIWLTSKNQLKDMEEASVIAEQMATATTNLKVAYYKELQEKGEI